MQKGYKLINNYHQPRNDSPYSALLHYPVVLIIHGAH